MSTPEYRKALQIGKTLWEVTVPCAQYNETVEVEVVWEGVLVNYQLIPWDDFMKARRYTEMKRVEVRE